MSTPAKPGEHCSSTNICQKVEEAPAKGAQIHKASVSASKSSIGAHKEHWENRVNPICHQMPTQCSCGSECGSEKCEGRNRSVLIGWDSLRTKIFICLFILFAIWLIVYVPLSLTVLSE